MGVVRQNPSAQTDNGDRAVERFYGRIDDQSQAGRVNGDRQEFGNRQAIGQTGGYRRWAGSRAGEGSISGRQTSRRGPGNMGADRPAGTRPQAGDQTGEDSVTGRISVGETFHESRESSVSIERRSGRD